MTRIVQIQKKFSQLLSWYGPARAFATAGSVIVVVVGAWWLIRAPAPPLENSLPMVGATAFVVDSNMPTSTTLLIEVARNNEVIFPQSVTVHVAGAVVKPGVYLLKPGARVIDAVSAAGGLTKDADAAAVNLALPLNDAEQVFLPVKGARTRVTVAPVRKRPASVGSPSSTAQTSTSFPATSAGTGTESGKVNINTATALQLEDLPSVGPSTARAIKSYREKNGPFAKAEDLLKVPGIGAGKLAAMKPFVVL